jgi:hypothetical protein
VFGVAGWMAPSDGGRAQSADASTESRAPIPAAVTAPDLVPAPATEPSAAASTNPSPVSIGPALRAAGGTLAAAERQSPPVARSPRAVRLSTAAVGSHLARVRTASATAPRARAHGANLDRAYDSVPSGDETGGAIGPADCSRLYHVFGGTRRVRSQCPAGDASKAPAIVDDPGH